MSYRYKKFCMFYRYYFWESLKFYSLAQPRFSLFKEEVYEVYRNGDSADKPYTT